jgi:hypothetical protein
VVVHGSSRQEATRARLLEVCLLRTRQTSNNMAAAPG